jgi:hypothetical protein
VFVENDLEELALATGLSETEVITHQQLGKEYIACLRLQHSMGHGGALNLTTKIDMLRRLGFSGRPRPTSEEAINWRLVRKGLRVIVTPDPKNPKRKHGGAFQFYDEGLLVVLLDGSLSGPEEFSKDQVAVAPEGSLPFQPTPEQLQPSANGQPQTEPDTEIEDTLPPAAPEVTHTPDRADPTRGEPDPVMEKDWSEFDAGSPVWYRVGRNLCAAEFVDIGPKDGHVTIAVWTPDLGEDGKPLKVNGKKAMRQVHKLVPETIVSQEAPEKQQA